MPKPHKGEKKSDYIGRAVKEIMGEGKTQEQALGQAYGMWRQHHKEKAFLFTESAAKAALDSWSRRHMTYDKGRGPPFLAEAVGTRAMDEEGLPVLYADDERLNDDNGEDELEEPDNEDAEDLAEEAEDLLDKRARTFAQVTKQQPSIQSVHVTGAARRSSELERKQLEIQEEEADLSDPVATDLKGEKRRLRGQKRWSLPMKILKADPEQRLIFGWASVVESDGHVVVDKQGDIIPYSELEKAAYEYVLASRDGGDMHQRRGVSKLVASVVLTPEIKHAMGIKKMEPDNVGWFVGFKVHDDDLWKALKAGERPDFSIGGASMQCEVEDVDTYLAHSDVFKARGRRHARAPFRY